MKGVAGIEMAEAKGEEVMLFGKWRCDGVQVSDRGLQRYICLKPIFAPHSGGRHEHRRFGKSEISIVEKLANEMMRYGQCGGKKARALNIVRNAFEIVHLKTGKDPVQVLVSAIENSAPCEDTTRISYGGIVYHHAVDISPMRRVDLAMRFITEGTRRSSIGGQKTIDECLADELIAASERDSKSYAVQRRDEMERVALSSR